MQRPPADLANTATRCPAFSLGTVTIDLVVITPGTPQATITRRREEREKNLLNDAVHEALSLALLRVLRAFA
jgi:hypothetical protein